MGPAQAAERIRTALGAYGSEASRLFLSELADLLDVELEPDPGGEGGEGEQGEGEEAPPAPPAPAPPGPPPPPPPPSPDPKPPSARFQNGLGVAIVRIPLGEFIGGIDHWMGVAAVNGTLPAVERLVNQLAGTLDVRKRAAGRMAGGSRRGRFDGRRSARAMAGSELVFRAASRRGARSCQIALLLDESGSMESGAVEPPPCERVRRLGIALHRVLSDLAGVRVSVWGHSIKCRVDLYHHEPSIRQMRERVYWPSMPNGDATPCNLLIEYAAEGRASALPVLMSYGEGGNSDGQAMAAVADEMLRSGPADDRVLILLSDGAPDCVERMRAGADYARSIGVRVLGVGIDRVFASGVTVAVRKALGLPDKAKLGDVVFGEGRWADTDDENSMVRAVVGHVAPALLAD